MHVQLEPSSLAEAEIEATASKTKSHESRFCSSNASAESDVQSNREKQDKQKCRVSI